MASSFQRSRIKHLPLSKRVNRCNIPEDIVALDCDAIDIPDSIQEEINYCARSIIESRSRERSVVLAFGAHVVKNGLALVVNQLMENGWVTHLATNGASVIHDWEFAFLGATSENVATNISDGRFGNWHETGFWINLALAIGAYRGLGYGESVGSLIEDDGIEVPSRELLREIIADQNLSLRSRAAAIDVLATLDANCVEGGWSALEHQWKPYSIHRAAWVLGIPCTAHPMFGHDVIYNHPMSCGASIGRTAERDWLSYLDSISRISGGVYLSVGSAVMSPMIFEKAISACRNVATQSGESIEDALIAVVDIAKMPWDWTKGEPSEDSHLYYQRQCKTFSRTGFSVRSVPADNRIFLVGLLRALQGLAV